MAIAADSDRRRKRILLLVMLVLAAVFATQFSGLSLGELPTRGAIENEAKKLRAAHGVLARAKSQDRQDDRRLQGLNSQAAPFWAVSGRTPHQEVRQEFDALVRRGQITNCRVQNPQTSPMPGYAHLQQVEFTVQFSGTMKVVTRLLSEMERKERVFVWSYCSITTNRTMPTEVRLNGKVRAIILSSEAQAMLDMEREEPR